MVIAYKYYNLPLLRLILQINKDKKECEKSVVDGKCIQESGSWNVAETYKWKDKKGCMYVSVSFNAKYKRIKMKFEFNKN